MTRKDTDANKLLKLEFFSNGRHIYPPSFNPKNPLNGSFNDIYYVLTGYFYSFCGVPLLMDTYTGITKKSEIV